MKYIHYIIPIMGEIQDGWSTAEDPDRDIFGTFILRETDVAKFYINTPDEGVKEFITEDGIARYLYDPDTKILYTRTEDEIAAIRKEREHPSPTKEDQLRADVDFIAAMMGVQL